MDAVDEPSQHLSTQALLLKREHFAIKLTPNECLHFKVSLLGASPKATMSLFSRLLRGNAASSADLRDPVGVDWGLRRLQHK